MTGRCRAQEPPREGCGEREPDRDGGQSLSRRRVRAGGGVGGEGAVGLVVIGYLRAPENTRPDSIGLCLPSCPHKK